MFRNLCNGNKDNQNFMRYQHTNNLNFNIVKMLVLNLQDMLKKLHHSMSFDYFVNSLETIEEFIQGPNKDNIEILVKLNFFDMLG